VLIHRLAGATLRGSAERAINRGAARNMVAEEKAEKRYKERESWSTWTEVLS
jgi:hypothetical protein